MKPPHEKASKYIYSFKELAKKCPGIKVVLYLRVSFCTQDKNGNFIGQEAYCRRKVNLRGGVVVGVFKEVVSGKVLHDRPEFCKACAKAREEEAIVVAVSVDRDLRNIDFHSVYNMEAMPTREEFEAFLELADGVPLATIIHPNNSPRTVRGVQAKYGQEAKGGKGGRPRKNAPGQKKKRRMELAPLARQRRIEGASLGQIAAEMGLPRSTIQDWCDRMDTTE